MNSPVQTDREKLGGVLISEPDRIDCLGPLWVVLKEPLAEDLKRFAFTLLTEVLLK